MLAVVLVVLGIRLVNIPHHFDNAIFMQEGEQRYALQREAAHKNVKRAELNGPNLPEVYNPYQKANSCKC